MSKRMRGIFVYLYLCLCITTVLLFLFTAFLLGLPDYLAALVVLAAYVYMMVRLTQFHSSPSAKSRDYHSKMDEYVKREIDRTESSLKNYRD